MSKMSQLHAELSEQAAELGFESIGEAEQAGYGVDWKNHRLIPDADKAYEDLDKTEKMNEEAKQIEMVHDILSNAKEMIAMVYRPDGNAYCNPIRDITDEKIRDYYYEINHMCCELSDRNKMIWQKEDNEDKG
jgi:DNA-binding Lrp family transcriptional regulator